MSWRRSAAAWRSPRVRVIAVGVTGGVLLLVLLIAALALTLGGPGRHDAARTLRGELHAVVQSLLAEDQLARRDGHVYTVDLAQLMTYAAMRRDATLYDALHARLIDRAVINELGVPFTAYFVAWRWRDGQPLDATGTTEALRLAEALWTGGHALDRPADRDLAVLILEAYLRHAAVDQDVWHIRNYFNLGTGAFATNSYLVDYDPDLLLNVAAARHHEPLRDAAARSAALVRASVTPAGLLHSIIQPELRTLMPGFPPIFSPNNVEQLGNVATVAERSVVSARAVAQGVLDFALARQPELRQYYDAATGQPLRDEPASVNTIAPLLRLAVRLGDEDAADALLDLLLDGAGRWTEQTPVAGGDELFTLSEVLLALQTVLHPRETAGDQGKMR